jgi:hypothetical protein
MTGYIEMTESQFINSLKSTTDEALYKAVSVAKESLRECLWRIEQYETELKRRGQLVDGGEKR